jgi:hypothetical protein
MIYANPNDFKFPQGFTSRKLSATKLSEDEKAWLGNLVNTKRKTAQWVAGNWKLPITTIRGWAAKCRVGLKPGAKLGGRPRRLSKEEVLKLAEKVNDCKKHHMSIKLVVEAINEAARQSPIHDPKTGEELAGELRPLLSASTIRNYCKEADINKGIADRITEARLIAISSLRNAVSHAVGQYVYKDIIPELTFNLDATHTTVGQTKAQRQDEVAFVGQRKDQQYGLKAAPGEDGNGLLEYSIKTYILDNAAGHMAPPVFVVADSQMAKEDFHAIHVPELDLGVQMGDAYVVFCHDRSCNEQFYQWLNRTVIMPFIEKAREKYGDFDSPALLLLDGEAKQIDIYDNDAMVETLVNKKISVCKFPASTTAINQPVDFGNLIKAMKTALLGIHDKDVKDCYLKGRLDTKILTAHDRWLQETYPTTSGAPRKFNQNHRKPCILGLLRVHRAMCNTVNPTTIRNSFEGTGIRPYNRDKILGNCKATISKSMYRNILGSWNTLVAYQKDQGEIFDKQFAAQGIFDELDIDKDDKVVNQRRFIDLTAAGFREREREKKEADAARQREIDARREEVAARREAEAQVRREMEEVVDLKALVPNQEEKGLKRGRALASAFSLFNDRPLKILRR